jgi:peptidoglycan hydrolase CwlO-like protein
MKPMSAKNKIVIAVVLWLVVSAAMIMYGFNIFSGSNQKMLFQIQESKKELAALQEEKKQLHAGPKRPGTDAKKRHSALRFF